MSALSTHRMRGALFLLIAIILCAIAGRKFLSARHDEPLYPATDVNIKRLSDYFGPLKDTRADSEVYIIAGENSGGTVLVLGGTHPNEVAGFLTAFVLIENVKVTQGRVIVIPRANRSAFTHTEPGEALPTEFEISTPAGARTFRVGCRFTNPLDQWPDPEVYLHHPSGQQLSGNETRNMNRAYPGRPDGDFTERAAHAITTLIQREKVDLVIDLHESSPEYPVINAMVAHERAMDIAALASLTMQAEGVNISLEPSPQNFHGLSHRELGDATETFAVLLESANIMQGRLRGATTADKILHGKDPWYLMAAKSDLLRVPYDSTGISIDVRVGRHLTAIRALIDALASVMPEKTISVTDIPLYVEITSSGIGGFLIPKTKTR